MKIEPFIGRQLARLRLGKDYSNIIIQAIQTVSLVIIALGVIGEDVSLVTYVLFLNFGLVVFWVIGLITQKTEIREFDQDTIMRQNIRGAKTLQKEVYGEVIVPLFKEALREIIEEMKNGN